MTLKKLFIALVFFINSASASVVYKDVFVTGSIHTRITDINNNGMVSGYYQDAAGNHAFSLLNGVYDILPFSTAWGISDAGDFIGTIEKPQSTKAISYRNGTLTEINFPGSIYTAAQDINNEGVIVGIYLDVNYVAHGFTLSNGNYFESIYFKSIYGLNDKSEFVGTSYDGIASILQGDVFSPVNINNRPFGSGITVFGINNFGTLVGISSLGVPDSGFVHTEDGDIFINYPGTFQTQAYKINDAGTVVGAWWNVGGDGYEHGFIATVIDAVNTDPSAVPEPPIVGLILAGLTILGISRVLKKA